MKERVRESTWAFPVYLSAGLDSIMIIDGSPRLRLAPTRYLRLKSKGIHGDSGDETSHNQLMRSSLNHTSHA